MILKFGIIFNYEQKPQMGLHINAEILEIFYKDREWYD